MDVGSTTSYNTVKSVRSDDAALVIVNRSAHGGNQSPIHSRPRLPSPESINGSKHVNIIKIGASTDDLGEEKHTQNDRRASVYSALEHNDSVRDYQYAVVDKSGTTAGSEITMRSSGFFEEDDVKSIDSDPHAMSTVLEASDESGSKSIRKSNTYVSEPTTVFTTTVTTEPPPEVQNTTIPVSMNPDPYQARRGSNTTEDSEDRWIPWSDQAWVNTATASRASVTSALPSQLPASTTSVTSALSQKYVMPQHSRQLMKQHRGPGDLKVHQARLINAVNYAAPKRYK